ncbi:MAG: YHS domain protein, partial [Sulfitobacter sp.]|nr:YHS domain protein [Sulfitobacter sp.]
QVGSDDHTVNWNGALWRFAKQDDADQFAGAPERFAPQFGGFCARAMSLGKVVDADPEVWRIFEGRLYLFARPAGGKVFDKGEAEIISKAQHHWQTLY